MRQDRAVRNFARMSYAEDTAPIALLNVRAARFTAA